MKNHLAKLTLTWPGLALCLFLQRTPVLKSLVEVEFALAPRVLHVAKVFVTSAVSLGAYHTVTGATGDFQVTGSVRGEVGEHMAVAVQAERATPRRVEIVGDLPPGIETNQDSNGEVPNGTVLFSGIPNQAGTYPVTLRVLTWGVPRAPVRELDLMFDISLAGPVITQIPVSQRVVAGSTLRLEVQVADETGATYQWQRRANDGTGFAAIAGATSRVYSVSNVTAEVEGSYRVVVRKNGVVVIVPGPGDAPAFVTVEEPTFEVWKEMHFDDPVSEAAGALSNPDGDALPNLLEFLFYFDPQAPDTGQIPSISTEIIQETSYRVFTFPALRSSNELEVLAEASDNLSSSQWAQLVGGEDGVIIEQTPENFVLKLPDSTRVFSRLRVVFEAP